MNSILSPLYWVVTQIIILFHRAYSLVFHEDSGWAWGLSIVSLVVVIRIALIPLFVRQIKATRNMQALQPRMKKIQERYKNDRQRQSEEMMKLYRETGTNPLASCLPILAQSPFFIALFQVLNHIANRDTVGILTQDQVDSAREATIFGAPIAARFLDSASRLADLGASVGTVRTVTIIMIILMSASQFYTQRQLMTKNVDLTVKTPFMNQQKMLMYIFPIMFAVFGINFPVGVLIYWLTTNVWSMGQQLYVINRNPTPGSLAYKQRQEKLRKKGKLTEEPVETETKKAVETARANRTQPKRQSKSQRQSPRQGQQRQGQQAKKQTPSREGAGKSAASEDSSDAADGSRNGTRPASGQGGRGQGGGKAGGAKKSQPRRPKPSAKSKK
ncbi:membrane protein insertase YidC [Streptomyces sp. PT12]|uniref:membrane protein insertase YidC n=1 Tax=Streptomyces sp. PT12 TaxID=1510197 RepID=UPI000DE2CA2F|nr:membrane protein insertase YidC [Streptomyces sp. PT12]RBM05683.1 membrane protein insertase YidC [Streptomyces sp. PT12]